MPATKRGFDEKIKAPLLFTKTPKVSKNSTLCDRCPLP